MRRDWARLARGGIEIIAWALSLVVTVAMAGAVGWVLGKAARRWGWF